MNDTVDRPVAGPPVRRIGYAVPAISCATEPGGTMHMRSRTPLAPCDPSLARLFRSAVEAHPARLFLAERNAGGHWQGVTYEAVRVAVDALAQSLLDRGLSAERPAMIMSGNTVDHALLMLAGYTVGIPVAPISVAYSLQSRDHAKLKHIAALLDPSLVYVDDTAPFAKALAALDLADVEVVASRNGANLQSVTLLDDLKTARPRPALDDAVAAITSDTIAKIPVHVRLHELAQGRRQYPWHADSQSAADRAGVALSRRAAARARGLAAVEPHVRRQS